MNSTSETLRFAIRRAIPADVPAIRAMQQRSMWVLGGSYYSDDEIAGFLTQYGTMDDAIVGEGRFFVAMNQVGRILGSGGWTRRRPDHAKGFGENPVAEALPTVGGVFVDPAAERRGIASSLMARVEKDAVENEVEAIFLTATLPGAALYERLGYLIVGRERLSLNNGSVFACVRMMKRLKAADRLAA